VQVTKRLQSHHSYSPGVQPESWDSVVKLNTNENPYPPSPSVIEAVTNEINLLNLYPNPTSMPLREKISQLFGLDKNQVIIGNGSDDLLNICVRSFSDDILKVGMLDPSYSLYNTLVNVQGANLIKIPFIDDEFSFDPVQISSSGANLFFLTSPHAPSGRSFSLQTLRETAESFSGLLVIDEAYADFAAETALPLLNDLENVLITRTLSKSYSLAGLRLGFAMGHPSIIAQLDQVREVYNVDRLAQAAALASLNDKNYFSNCLDKILEQRQWLTNQFEAMNWRTIPSSTNFVFTQPCDANGKRGEKIAQSLFEFLNRRKILVRYFADHPLTNTFLRISIGKQEEMSILIDSIEKWKCQEKEL
jgi:histidinol-phosphate aminotransferase